MIINQKNRCAKISGVAAWLPDYVLTNSKEKTIEDVTKDSKVVTILELQGVRFSSSSFQFQFILRHLLHEDAGA